MKAVIGIDYGTFAARGILIDSENGNVLCSHSINCPHGVMRVPCPVHRTTKKL